jgi:hypothetical protein
MGSVYHDNKHLDSRNGRNLHEQLSDHQFLKDSVSYI